MLWSFDEASRIKNPDSATTKWLMNRFNDASMVRLANGTPMANSVMDLYPQLRAVFELNGWNRYAFRNRFAITGGFMGKQITGFKNEEELFKILDRCAFRALKKDYTDLPEKMFVPRKIEMHPLQREAYEEMLEGFYMVIEDQEVSAEYAITQAMKLQQISSGFIIDDEGVAHDIIPSKKNPKLLALKDIAQDTYGKMIIPVVFNRSMDMLLEAFPKTPFIRGGMEPDEVDDNKRRFNNDPDVTKIVLQMQAGSMGHTLLGKAGAERCSTTTWYENSYSLLLRKQMEDRNHRYGQDTSPYHVDFWSSPIELKIIKALQRKEDMAAAIVDAVRETHIV